MTKAELKTILVQEGIPEQLYCLDGGYPDSQLCLWFDAQRWSVYHSERGSKYGECFFATESEACEHFLHGIRKQWATIQSSPTYKKARAEGKSGL